MSYINKTDAINELLIKGHTDAAKTLWDFPIADVVEQKKGKWIDVSYPFGFSDTIPVCSECGCAAKYMDKTSFCPYCGTDMREE